MNNINLHVNNGKYLEILTDSISEKLIHTEVKGIDIQYLHESQMNDILAVYCNDVNWKNASEILFTMENKSKEKETCRCRILFEGN